MRDPDWVEKRFVSIDKLKEGRTTKEWKVEFLRFIYRCEGKFRNPLIVLDSGCVLVGSNRLLALRAEGVSGEIEVLMVGSIEGMIRAFSEYYIPKLSPDEVINHIVSGSPE